VRIRPPGAEVRNPNGEMFRTGRVRGAHHELTRMDTNGTGGDGKTGDSPPRRAYMGVAERPLLANPAAPFQFRSNFISNLSATPRVALGGKEVPPAPAHLGPTWAESHKEGVVVQDTPDMPDNADKKMREKWKLAGGGKIMGQNHAGGNGCGFNRRERSAAEPQARNPKLAQPEPRRPGGSLNSKSEARNPKQIQNSRGNV